MIKRMVVCSGSVWVTFRLPMQMWFLIRVWTVAKIHRSWLQSCCHVCDTIIVSRVYSKVSQGWWSSVWDWFLVAHWSPPPASSPWFVFQKKPVHPTGLSIFQIWLSNRAKLHLLCIVTWQELTLLFLHFCRGIRSAKQLFVESGNCASGVPAQQNSFIRRLCKSIFF